MDIASTPCFQNSNGHAERRATVDALTRSSDVKWWFDGREAGEPELWAALERSNAAAVLARPAELERLTTTKQRIAFVTDANELAGLARDTWVLTPVEELRVRAKAAGHQAGLLIEVSDLERGLPPGQFGSSCVSCRFKTATISGMGILDNLNAIPASCFNRSSIHLLTKV